jgi:hypothetical protein
MVLMLPDANAIAMPRRLRGEFRLVGESIQSPPAAREQ